MKRNIKIKNIHKTKPIMVWTAFTPILVIKIFIATENSSMSAINTMMCMADAFFFVFMSFMSRGF